MRAEIEKKDSACKGEAEEDYVGPALAGDFGMNYPLNYVRRAVDFLRQFNSWPDSGGWADQDTHLLDDIDQYVRIEHRLKWEVENGVPPEGYQEPQDTGSSPIFRMDNL